jgi:hypothetical protein
VKIFESTLGPDHYDNIPPLICIGDSYDSKNEFEKAFEFKQRALNVALSFNN